MISIGNIIKDVKYKIQRSGWRYSDYLKQNGINDNISLMVAKKYDDVFIPTEVGEELKNISDFNKNTMFIYKVKHNNEAETIISDVFNSGISVSEAAITSVAKACSNFWMFMDKMASTAKDEISFLIKIPNDCLKGRKPMYYEDGDNVRLLPEFVYGMVDIRNNKLTLLHNQKYTDTHDYLDDGLIAEGEEIHHRAK